MKSAPYPGRPLRALRSGLPALVLFILLLAAVELSVAQEWVSPLVLAPPSDVSIALADGFMSGKYLVHGGSTLGATLVGFLLAAAIAIAVAGLMTSVDFINRLVMPYIVGLQSMPKIALAPLIILWMGFGLNAKVAIVSLIAFFPIVVNALEGFRIRDRVQYELMVTLGSSKWQIFRSLRFPAALPSLFAGLHVGLILALLGAVVAELVGTRSGLGYLLLQDKAVFNVAGVFAILFVLLLIGQLMHWFMRKLEARVTFWAVDVSKTSA